MDSKNEKERYITRPISNSSLGHATAHSQTLDATWEMKISKVNIENFRSLEKAEFLFRERAAIVGENNSGKSSILRALNCFFNLEFEREHFLVDDHQYTSNRHPKIEIYIQDCPSKNIYTSNLNRDGLLQMKLTYSRSTKRPRFQVRVNISYKDAPTALLDELSKDLKFVYIPAIRDHRQTVATEKSLLRRLLKIYVDDYLSKRDNVTPKIKDILKLLENNALKKLSKEIDSNYLLDHKFEIRLSHINTPSYEILFEDLHLLINEKGNIILNPTVIKSQLKRQN